MKVLRAANHRRMPWKNGGGETVEIAVFPENSALGDFDWRVSMATVATDGSFSIFDGIDRTLSILTGAGMSLAIGGGEPVLLTKASAPLAFPADVPVTATLAGGTITDLNVMTRRGRFAHKVERLSIDGNWTGSVDSEAAFLLCVDGSIKGSLGSWDFSLGAYDALGIEASSRGSLSIHGHATCYLILIDAR